MVNLEFTTTNLCRYQDLKKKKRKKIKAFAPITVYVITYYLPFSEIINCSALLYLIFEYPTCLKHVELNLRRDKIISHDFLGVALD